MKSHWKIAVIANIKNKHEPIPEGLPPDAFSDYDSIETIDAIRAALEVDGHTTTFIHADRTLPYALQEYQPDFCFNIAEGLGGDAREAQVPALLEILEIPYTASRVLANAISLDKTLTKRIWRDNGLPVSQFQEFTTGNEELEATFEFPLFVKPSREGTGMGIDAKAIVYSQKELNERIHYLIKTYKQPALVETFLSGREFTVGILGGSEAKVYSKNPTWYDEKGYHCFPILELDMSNSNSPWVYDNEAKSKDVGPPESPGYFCPAQIDSALEAELKRLAIRAHETINALDVSRTDIRLDKHGEPQLIEINTLPGISPNYSDLCLQANAEGIAYTDLVLDILYLAAGRWGLIKEK